MIYGLLGIIAVFILGKIFKASAKLLLRLVINGLIGWGLLLCLNLFGSSIGLILPITKLSALITGTLGLPGIILMLVFRYIL